MRQSLPGPTSQDLIDFAAINGLRVTLRQLHRWRDFKIISSPIPYPESGVRGVKQLSHPEVAAQVVKVAEALRLYGSLDVAAWRLWFTEGFVPAGCIRALLKKQIRRVRGFEHALAVLEADDTDKEWTEENETWNAWEILRRGETERVSDQITGAIRRRVPGADFTSLVVTLLRLVTGDCDSYPEDTGHVGILNRVFGDDTAKSRIREFGELRPVLDEMNSSVLVKTLESYSDDELTDAKNEIVDILSDHQFLKTTISGKVGKILAGIFAKMLDGKLPTILRDELHLFLFWLSIRRTEEGKNLYRELLARRHNQSQALT
jgi:hypothetical protein